MLTVISIFGIIFALIITEVILFAANYREATTKKVKTS